MKVPLTTEIKALHKKYAPNQNAYRSVYSHCVIVDEIAKHIMTINRPNVDMNLVETGCMLHDIGAYGFYDKSGHLNEKNYITHGVLGYEVLLREGYPEKLRRFASCHTGVGLTAQQIKKEQLPLPCKDYVATTIEERLVMYADKFHSKSTPPQFVSFETYKSKIAKFGADKVASFESLASEFGIPDIPKLSKIYGEKIA